MPHVILVVGGTGELGLEIVRALCDRDEEVRVLARPSSNVAAVEALGAGVVRGDLSRPESMSGACEGAEVVVATANSIVPRRGERVRTGGLSDGYAALVADARRAGTSRVLSVSVPTQFEGRGALDFDERARQVPRLRADGPPLTLIRSSLFMQTWLPAVGSRLAVRGDENATLNRGYWLARAVGATTQRSLDRFGIASLPADGSARHSFIDVADLAGVIAAAVRVPGLPEELEVGGPEALSWHEVAEIHGRVLGKPIRKLRQPATPFRVLSKAARPVSPAAAHLLAVQHLVSVLDSVVPPENAERLVGRRLRTVEEFLTERTQLPAD